MIESIDQVQLRFNAESLGALNVILALIMYGVALDIRVEDFRRVLKSPQGPVIGLFAQFVLFPAVTYTLTRLFQPAPSIALGMILIAACPAGNISNIITHLSGGNTALSVSMSSVSTAVSVVATPFLLAFWGSLNPATADILRQVHLDPADLFLTILMILGLPMVLGMSTARWLPGFAAKIRKPMKIASIVFFGAFVIFALAKNFDHFLQYVGVVMVVVAVQDGLAFAVAYALARLLSQNRRDSRAIAVESGIHNSGLGLTLIFTFFGGLGGMAIVAAWWGIWHIVAGLGFAALCTWSDKRWIQEAEAS